MKYLSKNICVWPLKIIYSCTIHHLSQSFASEILNSALFEISTSILFTDSEALCSNKAENSYKAKTEKKKH